MIAQRSLLGWFAVAAALVGPLLSTDPASSAPTDGSEGGMIIEDDACRLDTPNWARDVWFRIRRYWDPLKLVEQGKRKRGAVSLHFYIGRDGQVLEVITLRRKGRGCPAIR